MCIIYIIYNYCLYIAYVSYVYAALKGVGVVNEAILTGDAHWIFYIVYVSLAYACNIHYIFSILINISRAHHMRMLLNGAVVVHEAILTG